MEPENPTTLQQTGSGTTDPIRPRRFDRRIRTTAIHEAGHIIACLCLHVRFVGADIHKDSGSGLGRVEIDHFSALPIDKQLIILSAGSAAERLVVPKRSRSIADWFSSKSDRQEAEAIMHTIHPDWSEEETTAYLSEMRRRAEAIIAAHLETIMVIANALLERGSVGSGDVAELWTANGG